MTERNYKKVIGYAVFEMPTKEARVFAGKRPQRVSDIHPVYDDGLKDILASLQQGGYYDETIDRYEVKAIKK